MISLNDILGRNTARIFDFETVNPVFEKAHIMRISGLESSTPTQYAVESGETRTDGHRVRNLGVVTVDFIINTDVRNTYAEFRKAWSDGRKFTIQSRADTFTSYVIVDMPREEIAEVEGSVGLQVRFQEWIEIIPEFGEMPLRTVASANNADTTRGGLQAGAPVQNPTSLLNKWFGDLL